MSAYSGRVGGPVPVTIDVVGGRDPSGNIQPVNLDVSGNLLVSGTGGGGAVTIADGADVAEGSTADAAWSGTGAGTVVSVLKKIASAGGGAVSIADGADVAEGATTDVAVVGDNAGTVSAKLRGLNKILADVWSSGSHWLQVSIQNATLAVTQSGAWVLSAGAAIIGKVGIDQTTPGTTNGVQTLTGSTTAVTQATAASLNAQVVGSIASGAADSGNPVKTGGVAQTSLPAAATAGNRVNFLADVYGRLFTRTGTQGPAGNIWTAIHVPATNTQATATKASAGAGVRNVCTGFSVAISANSGTPTALQLTVSLIDGTSGGTTYLWRSTISLPAIPGATVAIVRGGLWLPGSAATALTLEFSAAGGASTFESVSMEGTTVAE